MRAIILLPLLLLSACTIREETFSPRDNANSGLSFNPPDLNAPAKSASALCPGGYAQTSTLQDMRDGSQDLFCD